MVSQPGCRHFSQRPKVISRPKSILHWGNMGSRFYCAVFLLVLFLASLLVLASGFSSFRVYSTDNRKLTELNITVTPGTFDLEIPGHAGVQVDSYYYGIMPRQLMELSVNTMVCAWAALAVGCSAFFFLTKRFVWSRKKTASIALLTIIGATALTFVTCFHQVKPQILDAEEVYSGYPFVWLFSSRGSFWGGTEWVYSIQWYGLLGNIALYMWIIFAATVGLMILPKVFSKRSLRTH